MPVNMIYVWLIVIAVLLVVEFATAALTTIWFAGGALLALICAFLGGPVWLQVFLIRLQKITLPTILIRCSTVVDGEDR